MRISFVFVLLVTLSQAGWLESWHRYQGQQAIGHHRWKQALEAYRQIDHPDDATRYTMANLHYRLGQYAQAMALYAGVHDPKLAYRRLHNLGNCAMQTGDIARAVALYQAALRLHSSQRSRHNLALAQAWLKHQAKIGAACTTNILPRRRSRKEGQANLDDNTTSDEGKWNEDNRSIVRADNVANAHTMPDSGMAEITHFAPKQSVIEVTQPQPMSPREEAKWDRTLADRPVKTLLIPLDLPPRSQP